MVDVWTPVIAALSAGQLTQEVIDKLVNATKDLLATKRKGILCRRTFSWHIDPGSFSSGFTLYCSFRNWGGLMGSIGLVIVSHSKHIAQGVVELISEVAKDVPITLCRRNRRWRNWNKF